MTWLKTIAEEIVGLFVDDGRFALTILLWLAIAGLLTAYALEHSAWGGVLLFGGLALILIESAVRRAGR
jgi:hypothetical protein